MAKVQFKMGEASAYNGLSQKDQNTFYFTTDDHVLYLGDYRIGADPSLADTVATLKSAVDTLNGADSVEGSVKKQIKDAITELQTTVIGSLDDLSTTVKDKVVTAINSLKSEIDALSTKIGDLQDLGTTAKDSVVEAINELNTKVGQFSSQEAVTVAQKETPEGDASVSYEIKQGGSVVGIINIPKDKFVQSAEIKTITETEEEHEPGTYIILTIANEAEGSSKLWIDVKSLVDTYEANNTEANVTVTVENHKIKANIEAGKITATELAAEAVTTEKIANGQVTTAKLHSEVAASLEKAESALQKESITEGTTNGAITVDGEAVNVHGLKDLAYKTEDNLGLGDLAKKNQTELEEDLDAKYDAINAASTAKTEAIAEANKYTDAQLEWGTIEAE